MTIVELMQAFDRGKDKAREAMSADDVVQIVQDLEDQTLKFIGQPADARMEVGSLPKWS